MISNFDKKNNNLSEITIVSRAVLFDNDKNDIWMVTNKSSSLIKLNIDNNIITECHSIPTSYRGEYGYLSMILHNQKIYIIPYNANELVIFDINTKMFDKRSINISELKVATKIAFSSACIYKQSIYLIGSEVHVVLRYDIEEQSFEKIYFNDSTTRFSIAKSIVYENCLYIAEAEKNIIHIMDLEKNKEETVVIDDKKIEGFSSFAIEKGVIYAGTKNGHVFVIKNKQINEIVVCEDVYLYEMHVWSECIINFGLFNSKLYITKGNNTTEKDISYIWNDFFAERPECSLVEMVIRIKNNLLFQSRVSGEIFLYNLKENEKSKLDIIIKSDCRKILYSNYVKKQDFIKENKGFGMKEYIQLIGENNE